jgi:hypothetical protein
MHRFHHAIADTAIPVACGVVVAGDDTPGFHFRASNGQFGRCYGVSVIGVDVDPVEVAVGEPGQNIR